MQETKPVLPLTKEICLISSEIGACLSQPIILILLSTSMNEEDDLEDYPVPVTQTIELTETDEYPVPVTQTIEQETEYADEDDDG